MYTINKIKTPKTLNIMDKRVKTYKYYTVYQNKYKTSYISTSRLF